MTRHTDLQRGMEKEEENVGSVKRNTRKQKRKNKEPEEPEPHAIGQKIRDVNGVGPKAVEALLAFASPAPKGEREEVNRLLKELQLQKTTQRQAIGANKRDLECDKDNSVVSPLLHGKGVVFSGQLVSMPRQQAQDICESYGK
jgi:NAD-dependent DNA ligase